MSRVRNITPLPQLDPPPRALTARSVVLSVLLGTDPPRLPVSLLVGTAGLFGIAEGTTRTALSRMATTGELEVDDGWYAIASDRLLQRRARQDVSRRGTTVAWAVGDPWVQAVVVAEGRRPADERAARRLALVDARLAELREGVWLRPDNLGAAAPSTVDDPGLTWWRATPTDPHDLVRRLWDLDPWASRAERLRGAMSDLVPRLDAGDRTALADGFVLDATILRHLQADPLLPEALLDSQWPGPDLRREFERFDAAYRAVLRGWFDEQRNRRR